MLLTEIVIAFANRSLGCTYSIVKVLEFDFASVAVADSPVAQRSQSHIVCQHIVFILEEVFTGKIILIIEVTIKFDFVVLICIAIIQRVDGAY